MEAYLFNWTKKGAKRFATGLHDNSEKSQTLTWNYKQYLANGSSSDWWRANKQKIPVGAPFFLIRLGAEPRGMIAKGRIIPKQPHNDLGTADPKKVVDLEFTEMVDPGAPLLDWERLRSIEKESGRIKESIFAVISSGISLGKVAAPLIRAWDDAWAQYVKDGKREVARNDLIRQREGDWEYVSRLERKRSLDLVRRKKEAAMDRDQKLKCEACDSVLADVYGPIAMSCIECHHLKWLSRTGPTETSLDDLALLCPNCHKAMHLAAFEKVKELRDLIAERKFVREITH